MSEILKRIDEHIEFHSNINSHKSDVAFFKEVKEHIKGRDNQISFLCEDNRKLQESRGYCCCGECPTKD